MNYNTEFDGDEVHKTTSVHVRQNLDNFLSNIENTKVFVKNKNELIALCREANILDRLQSNNELIYTKVTQTDGNVNGENNVDTKYLSAVKSGNMKTAQKLVDEAAEDFNTFDKNRRGQTVSSLWEGGCYG